jgi:hypothetical protein
MQLQRQSDKINISQFHQVMFVTRDFKEGKKKRELLGRLFNLNQNSATPCNTQFSFRSSNELPLHVFVGFFATQELPPSLCLLCLQVFRQSSSFHTAVRALSVQVRYVIPQATGKHTKKKMKTEKRSGKEQNRYRKPIH